VSTPTKVVAVGCGQIALAAHLPALAVLRDEGLVEVVACDADEAKATAAARQFGFTAATDWREAAAAADAVTILVPPGPSSEIAVAALEAGKHVVCEKPPGRDRSQAGAMAAAAAGRPELVTMVAFNRRYGPLYQRARDRSLQLGPPTTFSGRFSRGSMGESPSNTVTDWLTSDSIHALDLAIATMGFPTAVGVSRRAVGAGPDNVWTLHLHTDQGSALLFFHYAAGRRVERYEWAGPGYDVALEPPGTASFVEVRGGAEAWTAADEGAGDFWTGGGFVDEYRRFVGAVRDEQPRPESDFAYGARLMGLIGDCLDAPSGATVTVDAESTAAPAGTASATETAGTSVAGTAVEGRPEVLVHLPFAVRPRFFSVEQLGRLGDRAEIVDWSDDGAALADARAVITGRGAGMLPSDFVERAPNLGLVVVLGASVRGVQPEALLERGVAVTNTADAVARSVAEHTLALTLAGLRQIPQASTVMHQGGWRAGQKTVKRKGRSGLGKLVRKAVPLGLKQKLHAMLKRGGGGAARPASGPARPQADGGSDLRGEVVGLIGWSYTARRFAELLAPFGCTILVFSEAADPSELAAAGARPASLGELLGSARVVSLHRGLSDSTRGFFDAHLLAQLRPGSVLVNTARGELIDERALVERLQVGDIVAALDVFDEEPLPAKHALRGLDNVILTPHVASATEQEELRMGDEAVRIVLDWIEGRPIPAIDAARLARMT
jgi:D-3-phosphoglycerate dehydrogenase